MCLCVCVWTAAASSHDSLAGLFRSGFLCSIINVKDSKRIALPYKECVCVCVWSGVCLLWVILSFGAATQGDYD